MQAELEKKDKMDKNDDDRQAKQIEEQRQRQIALEGGVKERSMATDLNRGDDATAITFGLKV